MTEITTYSSSYYSMTWLGPKGYPENANAGRCYFTGVLGALRHFGENDVLFADGVSGDGFSFRWCPAWGAPAFNGGKGPFHEIWEYVPHILGYRSHWEEDAEGGFEEAFERLKGLIDRGIPVQVGLHYSLLLAHGAISSPRLAFQSSTMKETGFGHHVMVAGYDLKRRLQFQCHVRKQRAGRQSVQRNADNGACFGGSAVGPMRPQTLTQSPLEHMRRRVRPSRPR